MARTEANSERMGEVAVQSEAWLEQVSKHLHFIEGRLMAAEFLPFEVVRQFGQKIEEFRPRGGDWGWLLRSVQDISVRVVRQMARTYYKGEGEGLVDFEKQAYVVVRLLLEEALRRTLGFHEASLSMRCAFLYDEGPGACSHTA